MELTTYLRVALARWPIVMVCLVATIAGVFALETSREPLYMSTSTYVVRPTEGSTDSVRAIDTLNRGVEINSTFASIASSNNIKSAARALVDPALDTSGMSTSAGVRPGTNILEINVSGPRPEAVHAMAIAVGDASVAYISDLDETFELALLDEAREARNPEPSNFLFSMVASVILGLVVGVGLAVLADLAVNYFKQLRALDSRAEAVDSAKSGNNSPAQHAPAMTTRAEPAVRTVSPQRLSELFADLLSDARERGQPLAIGILADESGDGSFSLNRAMAVMPHRPKDLRLLALGAEGVVVVETSLDSADAEYLLMEWLSAWKTAIELDVRFGSGQASAAQVSIGVSSFEPEVSPELESLAR